MALPPTLGAVADDTEDWLFDDEDDEAFLAAWEEADRQAAEVLAEACPDQVDSAPPAAALSAAASALREGLESGRWPYDYFLAACGWADGDVPSADLVLWVSALASTISPPEDPGTDMEEQSAVAALMHADWLGMVVGLVRRGVGAEYSAEAAQHDIDTLPELEGDIEDPEGAFSVLSMAVTVLTPLWHALGVLDEGDRLTELGRWGLPHALLVTWSPGGDDEPWSGTEADGRQGELDEADAQTAIEVLSRGPVTVDELRRELAKEGVFCPVEQLRRSLIWRAEVYEYDDGLWGHILTLADDVLLTHRLTAEELGLGILDTALDLDLVGLIALDGVPLVAGGDVETKHAQQARLPSGATSGLAGPEGWLGGFSPGELVGLRYVGGQVAVERVREPIAEEVQVDVEAVVEAAQAATRMDAELGDDDVPGVMTSEIVLRARRTRPDLFRTALPPLSEIVAGAEGLETEGSFVGVTGTPWHGEPSWLSDDERSTYRTWRRALRAHGAGDGLPGPAELAELAEGLGDRLLDLVGLDMSVEPEAEPVVTAMGTATSGRASAVPHYLRSRAAEGRGDGAAWLEHLEAAVAADPGLRAALGDLADLRSVAGDAREAHRLYGLAGLDNGDPEMATVARYLQPPEGTGRNKPCPCGSGKKYKVCHGRTDRHSLSDRAPWLWSKVTTFAQRGANRSELLDWAQLLVGAERDSREVVLSAMADPFVMDLAAFDGELLSDFLEVVGSLLPEDERRLAEEWLGTPLRLMEVAEVRPMRGVRLHDLVTGEELEVLDRRMTATVNAKDLLFGRPLADGDGALRFQSSPLSIPRLMRGRMVAVMKAGAATEDVVEVLADASRPPQTTTSEGEELVVCTARYELSAPEEAWASLATELTPGGPDELIDDMAAPGGGGLVRGRVRRTADRLVVEADAIERLRRLQERVLAADPGARLVDESTRPLFELLQEEPAGVPGEPDELPQEVVEEIVRQQEQRWLGEQVPALAGHTPREAAQDPVLRQELVALLDDFEWTARRTPGALTMSVPRLRRELGIDEV